MPTENAQGKSDLLLLLDGHALMYRAWHAIQQPLNISATGEEVRAVYGFLNTLLKTISEWNPTHCAVAFDLPTPTFRHLQYEEYKAHRPPMPPELKSQLTRIRQVLETFRIPIFEAEGFEADDVLGTLSLQAEEMGLNTLILTGDTDTLQLVSPKVRVLLTFSSQKKTVYDEEAVIARYGGLRPSSLPDVKALQGDSSDNIPGIQSIGAKTAIRLVSEFGSLDGIYSALNDVRPERIQQKLRDHTKEAQQWKELATIVRDVPIDLNIHSSQFGEYSKDEVVKLLTELEFYSIVRNFQSPVRYPADLKSAATDTTGLPETRFEIVDSIHELEILIQELVRMRKFAFHIEATSTDPMTSQLAGIAISCNAGHGWYIPLNHTEGIQLRPLEALELLNAVFRDPSISKTSHNSNFAISVLAENDTEVQHLNFDTMLAAHLAGRKSLKLNALALECYNQEIADITDVVGVGRNKITVTQAPIERMAKFAVDNAEVTLRLENALSEELSQKGIRRLFDDVEMPLMPILVRMQRNGISLNIETLRHMSVSLGHKLDSIEKDIHEVVGHEFNLNSSRQLADVLFNELGLPKTKRTQTGYSTDASSLEKLKDTLSQGKSEGINPSAFRMLEQILEYRQLSKIKSTYVDALPNLVNSKTNRVHTQYNQTGSATGRVSSNDPNVQNIPVRTELGNKVRTSFVAENAPTWTLLSVDYSQIELRILAHLSQDPGLLKAFQNGEDIHSATASSVYDVPIANVTSEMRRIAKVMNFGVIYGLSPYGISQQTDFGPEEGSKFIETYLGRYPGIRTYIEAIKAQVRETGYVETILGRRRYIYEIRSTNHNTRAAGERMAINMPVQGTAADIIKIAMIRIQRRLDESGMRSMMIIQVHDELIFEVPREELEEMTQLVTDLMPTAMTLAVPLDVELKTGDSWGNME